MGRKKTGKNSHVCRPFKVGEKKFYTLRECAEYFGMKNRGAFDTIRKRLISKTRQDYQYI